MENTQLYLTPEEKQDLAKLEREGIRISTPHMGAFTGEFPTILVIALGSVLGGIVGGFLSEIGKDLWNLLKKHVSSRTAGLQERRGTGAVSTRHIVLGIYLVSEIKNVPIVYYSISQLPELDRDLLRSAETEISTLAGFGVIGKQEFLGINLENLREGPFFCLFKEIPSESSILDMMLSKRSEKELATHQLVGVWFEENRQFAAALKHYSLCVRLEPKNAHYHLALGNLHAAMGDFETAIVSWRMAVTLDPKNGTAHYNVASYAARQGRAADAIAGLQTALANGFNITFLIGDPDWGSLRSDKRVRTLLEKAQKKGD